MHPEFKTLSEILTMSNSLPYGLLYMQGSYPWNVNSLGIVYSRDDGDDLVQENPKFAKRYNLQLALEIGIVQDIVLNARRQKSDVSDDQLVQAFNHYYQYDAFLKL